MSTATLSNSRLGAAPSPKVSEALHELALAARGLLLALWAATLRRPRQAVRPLTVLEEANQLREIANDVLHIDPRFAQDLYVAADRHERLAGM